MVDSSYYTLHHGIVLFLSKQAMTNSSQRVPWLLLKARYENDVYLLEIDFSWSKEE